MKSLSLYETAAEVYTEAALQLQQANLKEWISENLFYFLMFRKWCGKPFCLYVASIG